MQRILVCPDVHAPYEDKRAVRLLFEFARDWKPDRVVCVGDLSDQEPVSRWSKGMPEEVLLPLENHIKALQVFLEELSASVSGAPIDLKIGNHDIRLETYVRKYAPGLLSLKVLSLEAIYGQHCTVHRKMFPIAPKTLCGHGDEIPGGGGTPGSTALKLVKKTGKSIVCGHNHRLALVYETSGYSGTAGDTLFGMECGNLLDIKKATYLQTGFANWQTGWAVLNVMGRKVFPSLVRVDKGQVVWGDKVYG